MKRLFILFIVLAVSFSPLFSQKKETYRVRTVVIDPGHGGAKPGAQGSRSWEKNITLAVAKKFGKLIEDNYKDVKVIYTRTNDADISLAERANIANRNKADLFISIHANSHPTSNPTGVETFVMGLSESKANLEVAKKENADILLEADYKTNSAYNGFDPNSPESWVVLTLYQNSFLDKSLNLAQAIQNQYKSNLKTINRGVKQAELFVLYKTTCPSVLTEIGFISNPTEESYMLSEEGQAQIAVCLFNAFMYFKATEEGTNMPANPVFNIPGYKSKASERKEEPKSEPKSQPKAEPVVADAGVTQAAQPAKKEEPKPEPKVEPKLETKAESKVEPASEPKAESKPQPVKEEPKAEPVSEPETVEPEPVKAEPNAEQAATPREKPTPTVELPKQEPKAEPIKEEPKQEAVQKPVQSETEVSAPERVALVAPQNTAADEAGQYYTVQFLTSKYRFEAGAPRLDGVSDFQITEKGNFLAYTTGRFATFDEAVAYRDHLRSATRFKDAWAFLYKVPAKREAQPATQSKTTAQQTNKPSETAAATADSRISYRIQLFSTNKTLKAGDPDLHGIKDFRSAKSGNLYIYTTGDYSRVADAQRRCAEIKRTLPFKDAFVFAVYNGERITLEQAAAMEKNKK